MADARGARYWCQRGSNFAHSRQRRRGSGYQRDRHNLMPWMRCQSDSAAHQYPAHRRVAGSARLLHRYNQQRNWHGWQLCLLLRRSYGPNSILRLCRSWWVRPVESGWGVCERGGGYLSESSPSLLYFAKQCQPGVARCGGVERRAFRSRIRCIHESQLYKSQRRGCSGPIGRSCPGSHSSATVREAGCGSNWSADCFDYMHAERHVVRFSSIRKQRLCLGNRADRLLRRQRTASLEQSQRGLSALLPGSQQRVRPDHAL